MRSSGSACVSEGSYVYYSLLLSHYAFNLLPSRKLGRKKISKTLTKSLQSYFKVLSLKITFLYKVTEKASNLYDSWTTVLCYNLSDINLRLINI